MATNPYMSFFGVVERGGCGRETELNLQLPRLQLQYLRWTEPALPTSFFSPAAFTMSRGY